MADKISSAPCLQLNLLAITIKEHEHSLADTLPSANKEQNAYMAKTTSETRQNTVTSGNLDTAVSQHTIYRQRNYGLVIIMVVMHTLVSNSIYASVTVDEVFNYYDVHGATSAEIRRSINTKRLAGAGSEQFDAQTRWSLAVDYEFAVNGDHCAINNASISVHIDYRMPRWGGSKAATTTVRNAWERYFERLLAHEKHHGEITKVAAAELHEQLLAVKTPVGAGSDSACPAFISSIDRLVTRMDRQINRMQADFDRRTGHGASFPQQ